MYHFCLPTFIVFAFLHHKSPGSLMGTHSRSSIDIQSTKVVVNKIACKKRMQSRATLCIYCHAFGSSSKLIITDGRVERELMTMTKFQNKFSKVGDKLDLTQKHFITMLLKHYAWLQVKCSSCSWIMGAKPACTKKWYSLVLIMRALSFSMTVKKFWVFHRGVVNGKNFKAHCKVILQLDFKLNQSLMVMKFVSDLKHKFF